MQCIGAATLADPRSAQDCGALGARMTGSGSGVFGVASDRKHAERIAEDFRGRGSDARCFVLGSV